MIKRVLGTTAVVCALLVPRVASAQIAGQGPTWLQDRRLQEGAGIRTGNLELHPGLGGEVGYDTNFLLRTHKEPPAGRFYINGNPEGAARIRITPSLSLSTLQEKRREGGAVSESPLTFRATLAATYMEFFGADIVQKQRNVSANVHGTMSILPGRPVGASFSLGYVRLVNPSALGNPDLAFTQNQIMGGGELILTPGGGTLDYRFGYTFQANIFETDESSHYNNLVHNGHVRGRWRFTPRTSIISDSTIGYTTYTNLRSDSALVSSMPLRSRLGIEGLVTPKIGIVLAAGYGATFQQTSEAKVAVVRQYDSVIGTARVTYYLTANPDSSDAQADLSTFLSRISIGYSRDFMPSVIAGFTAIDRGDIVFDAFIAGRASISLHGGVSAVQYPDIPSTSVAGGILHGASTDVRPDAMLFSEYRFSESFGLNTTLRYTANISKIELLQTPPPGTAGAPPIPGYFDFNWRRFEAYLGARWFL